MDKEDIWLVIIVFGLPVLVLIIWALYTSLKDDKVGKTKFGRCKLRCGTLSRQCKASSFNDESYLKFCNEFKDECSEKCEKDSSYDPGTVVPTP